MNSCECRPDADGGCRHWRLVRDEAELRPGMCVELRPCAWCGKRERIILARHLGMYPCEEPGGTCVTEPAFKVAGACPAPGVNATIAGFRRDVRERRLYRMVDDGEASSETTTTKRRERVR